MNVIFGVSEHLAPCAVARGEKVKTYIRTIAEMILIAFDVRVYDSQLT